jgi:DNA-binding NarL/FixJ family response regulator
MFGPIPPTDPRDEVRPLGDHSELLGGPLDTTRPAILTEGLSRSELDVLEDAANGLTTRQSASNRSKSAETVKSQRTSVLAKLGARNMVQAVAMTACERQIPSEAASPIRFG